MVVEDQEGSESERKGKERKGGGERGCQGHDVIAFRQLLSLMLFDEVACRVTS